jgi:2,4-dienoyl-CoA reductase-like NADH-dependent reductase (Old Yellow Enzyme family)
MAPHGRPSRARILARACVVSCGLLAACASQAMEGRPPLSAACLAWNSHIADLIDQHRTVHELDEDQIGDIIRLFYQAQSSCSALRFDEGLAIYEAIPIGPVASRQLR